MDQKFPNIGSENSDLLIKLVMKTDTNTGSDQPYLYLGEWTKESETIFNLLK